MLKIRAFGLACAIMWSAVVGWAIVLAMMDRAHAPFIVMDQMYFGLLAPTGLGLVAAIVISFADAYIAGMIFAWIYNKLAR